MLFQLTSYKGNKIIVNENSLSRPSIICGEKITNVKFVDKGFCQNKDEEENVKGGPDEIYAATYGKNCILNRRKGFVSTHEEIR